MFIRIFKIVGNSTTNMIGAGMLQIIAILFMTQRLGHLVKTFGAGHPPDLWFGYDSDSVYSWLEKVGPNGRSCYMDMVAWDLFPYMEAYTILLGSFMLKESETAKRGEKLALIFPLAMMCDLVETVLNGYATREFPNRIDDRLVQLSSIANQIKWILFASGLLILSYLFVFNYFNKGITVDADADTSSTGKRGKRDKKTN